MRGGRNPRPAYNGNWLSNGDRIYLECMRAQDIENSFAEIEQIVLKGIRTTREIMGHHRIHNPQLIVDSNSLA